MTGVGPNRRLLRSGGSAFASQWWIGVRFVSVLCLDRRLLRSGGSMFGMLADRRLVRRSDRRLDRSLSL